ncbi:MAG: fasciclin domain-containing protein [Planctomycetota bacterium]
MKPSTLMKSLLAVPMATMLTAGPALAGSCKSCNSCDKSYNKTVMVAAETDIVDTAVAAGSFKTLAAALGAADLVDALKGDGPFTVFAPTDEAFAALPEGTVENLLKPENKALLTAILTYHVVPGSVKANDIISGSSLVTLNGQKINQAYTQVDAAVGDIDPGPTQVFVDNAKVVKADIGASNGTIHVINKVMLPSTKDIIDTAIEAGSFKTLAAALGAAELVETLKGDGPFTVFAPTDDAFAALPAGTVESLLKPENKAKLQAVLTYHVVPGRIYAHDAIKAGKAKTVQGQEVTIKAKDGKVTVDGANVVAADIDSSNGVIHVIDAVILPKD